MGHIRGQVLRRSRTPALIIVAVLGRVGRESTTSAAPSKMIGADLARCAS